MRVAFVPPSILDFERLFSPSLRGGGLDDIKIYTQNRGSGILSFLGGLARKALPFLMNTIFPEGLSLAQNVLSDVNSGQKFKTVIKDRGMQSLSNVGKKLVGGKRKRPLKRLRERKKKKKSCFKDIFTGL